MNADAPPKPVTSTPLMRRVIFYTDLLLVAFLLGFVPMWLKARQYSRTLSEAERQLNLVRTQNALVSAIIDAQLGDYELGSFDISEITPKTHSSIRLTPTQGAFSGRFRTLSAFKVYRSVRNRQMSKEPSPSSCQ